MFSLLKNNHIFLLCCICFIALYSTSAGAQKKHVHLGKSTFNEQLQVDINTCIAYLENIKAANSIEEQRLNVETSAAIYRKIKPIYNYINDNFTFVTFEDDVISEEYNNLKALLADYPIKQELVTKKTNEILYKLLKFKDFATLYKIKKEDYALIVNHILHTIKKDIKQFKTTEKVTEQRIYSYLSYEKLSIYLSTFKNDFNKKSIYVKWNKSLSKSLNYSNPKKRQDSTQIAILRKQIAKQKELLLKTAADWNLKYGNTRYADTFFEDENE